MNTRVAGTFGGVTHPLHGLSGALMVCGTTSDSGKSTIVAGLARSLVRAGVRVAPFKAQNMANNSFITASGHEIGRAQGMQAMAACVPAEVAMNPVLLKPSGERVSQVVVLGRPHSSLTAAEYHEYKPELLKLVLQSLEDLRGRFDVVLCEGAGSPTEINLLAHDIVNLRIAHEADLAAIVVGDINPGGVFAALYGTVSLLPPHYRQRVRGFIINKLRGDPALLFDGTTQLRDACGVPTLGVLPWITGLTLDAEDSMNVPSSYGGGAPLADALDIAVVRLPYISNFTDFDPLSIEAGVNVRFVHHGSALGRPDLVIVPGSKSTVRDMAWLHEMGFATALRTIAVPRLGICAGYQMFGRTIQDEVESSSGVVEGLGLLDVHTVFHPDKVTAQRRATSLGHTMTGYQIHHGRVTPGTTGQPWVTFDDGVDDGAVEMRSQHNGVPVMGTTMHGMFESDEFRRAFLREIAEWAGKTFVSQGVSFAAARDAQINRVADALEAHVNLAQVAELISTAPTLRPV